MTVVFKTISTKKEYVEPDETGDTDIDGEIEIKFVLSDESMDRDGDIIRQSGWDLEAYKKNPIVTWAHDIWSLPVGKAKDVFVDAAKKTLMATVVFPSESVYEFGHKIGLMYKHGFLNAVSVGFIPSERKETADGYVFEKQSLHEFGCVPLPANANAVAVQRSTELEINKKEMIKWAKNVIKSYNTPNATLGDKIPVEEDLSNTANSCDVGLAVEPTLKQFEDILREEIKSFSINL